MERSYWVVLENLVKSHRLEEQRGFPSCGQRDRHEDTNRQECANHERAILSDFEDRGRGHELRCAGSVVNTGVAGTESPEVTVTLDLAQGGSCLLASRAAG